MSTLTNEKNIRNFETVALMKLCDALEAGMICETLGYYRKGDGGGARYIIETAGTESANEMDIIEITGEPDGSDQLIARFMHEGKPVNVLQFGARNYYRNTSADPNGEPFINDSERDDSKYIQRAIEYTNDRLSVLENGFNTYNINSVNITGGNYVIRNQINMPPYMQLNLDGDVQLYSYVNANDIQLYRYDPEYEDVNGNKPYFVKINDHNEIFGETEVFAKNEFVQSEKNLSIDFDDEYYVYKKGIIKICCRYNQDGTINSPYARVGQDGSRYAIAAATKSEVFCGDGSLTILNKTRVSKNDEQGKEITAIPCYICGVEIGNTEDFIRFKSENSQSKGKKVSYSFLNFSNLKITECYIGFLSHVFTFYSNVIKNTEFFKNIIAFQFGVYGEKTWAHEYSTFGVFGEGFVDSAEMNHFRDCLFTGNKISVNIMLSGAILNFNSCHFDFDNCIFRAAYRTSLTMANCHIEGIGKEIGEKYFGKKNSNDEIEIIPPTKSLLKTFQKRAGNDHLDEFIGILYAKPIKKINGVKIDQYSFVNLSIVNSMIVENVYMPWSIFSYYNDEKDSLDTTDGHHRSNLHLENITYATAGGHPVSYLTTTDNGALHSGFLLSEYSETELGNAVQNVPVISRDSKGWGAWSSSLKNSSNHRFLSNRTLANKYPYFQNVEQTNGDIGGIAIAVPEAEQNVVVYDSDTQNPFFTFDENAGFLKIKDVYYTTEDPSNASVAQPQIELSFDEDIMECSLGDTFSAAIVTNVISCNSRIVPAEVIGGSYEERVEAASPHTISFVECDEQGTPIEKYTYDVPYCVDFDKWYYYEENFPSTSSCRHIVKNKNAKKIKIIINFSRAVIYTCNSVDTTTYTNFHALLVEKNK